MFWIIIFCMLFCIFLCKTFIILEICGDSMYPTLKNGEYYLAIKTLHLISPAKLGKIYAAKLPKECVKNHEWVIKRVTNYDSSNSMVYLKGDNKDNSYDSRSFGCISMDCLKYRILFKVWGGNKND